MGTRVARLSIALALAGALVPVGLAWEAIPWGGTPTTWEPTQGRQIVILAPGTYKFYATDGGPPVHDSSGYAASAARECPGISISGTIVMCRLCA